MNAIRIAIVDDESSSVEMLSSIIAELLPKDRLQLACFTNPLEARDYLTAHKSDVVFLDIEMPVISGMDIAGKIMDSFEDPPEIIFVTAYPQYSLDAWKFEAIDYVLKPYDPEQIEKALSRAWLFRQGKQQEIEQQNHSLPFIRCFSDFDVLVDNRAIEFPSRRARELLALLVHHRGSWVGLDSIAYDLLEEVPETSAKNYIRMILTRLRRILSNHGISNILETRYGEIRVNPSAFECDYYDYLAGKKIPFHGTYMGEYSWAQEEAAYLWRKENT